MRGDATATPGGAGDEEGRITPGGAPAPYVTPTCGMLGALREATRAAEEARAGRPGGTGAPAPAARR